ncbi:SH3 domain-containing protein [Segnochrobactraceae bacterium EtOH-i3]
MLLSLYPSCVSAETVASLRDGYLSVRTGPGTYYPEISRLPSGRWVHVIDKIGTWRRVRLPDGREGWVYGRYLLADIPSSMPLADQIRWIVVVSRSNVDEAVAIAQNIEPQVPSVTVFQSSNGYYAVTLGYVPVERAREIIDALIAKGVIPQDSFLSGGERWVREVPIARARNDAPSPREQSAGADDASVVWGIVGVGVAALVLAAFAGSDNAPASDTEQSLPSSSPAWKPTESSSPPSEDGFTSLNNGCYWGYGELCH